MTLRQRLIALLGKLRADMDACVVLSDQWVALVQRERATLESLANESLL